MTVGAAQMQGLKLMGRFIQKITALRRGLCRVKKFAHVAAVQRVSLSTFFFLRLHLARVVLFDIHIVGPAHLAVT